MLSFLYHRPVEVIVSQDELCSEERLRHRLPIGLTIAPGRDTLDLLRVWIQTGVSAAGREAVLTRTGWYWVDG